MKEIMKEILQLEKSRTRTILMVNRTRGPMRMELMPLKSTFLLRCAWEGIETLEFQPLGRGRLTYQEREALCMSFVREILYSQNMSQHWSVAIITMGIYWDVKKPDVGKSLAVLHGKYTHIQRIQSNEEMYSPYTTRWRIFPLLRPTTICLTWEMLSNGKYFHPEVIYDKKSNTLLNLQQLKGSFCPR